MEFWPVDLGRRHVPYHEAWDLQRQVHAEVVAGTRPDTVLLVEHESVYTAGRRTAAWDRPVDGTPVVDVDRGGRITWHGPGQLVAYPIVRLAEPVDVVAYVRALEAAIIEAVGVLGVTTQRSEGRSGVWMPTAEGERPRKLAAIGVRVARDVTMHGLALNCDCDLGAFARIVPCGLPDADATSLTAELGRRVTIADVEPHLRAALDAALAPLRAAVGGRERTVAV
jgi:lipoyl(octanoyl) transferase